MGGVGGGGSWWQSGYSPNQLDVREVQKLMTLRICSARSLSPSLSLSLPPLPPCLSVSLFHLSVYVSLSLSPSLLPSLSVSVAI